MKKMSRSSGAIAGFLFVIFSACLPDSPDIPTFEEQLAIDIAIIDNYLEEHNIDAIEHQSGLRYVIHSQGAGNQPTVDSCVTTNYVGYLLNASNSFDHGSNFSFRLLNVIGGWQLGIPLLHEGDSATFYIPSGFCYGYSGIPPTIPGNSNLVFGVKLLKVGRVYNQLPSPAGTCE